MASYIKVHFVGNINRSEVKRRLNQVGAGRFIVSETDEELVAILTPDEGGFLREAKCPVRFITDTEAYIFIDSVSIGASLREARNLLSR